MISLAPSRRGHGRHGHTHSAGGLLDFYIPPGMADDEFEEIYGILLEEVTAEDDIPVDADTMEMLSEIASRDDADDGEIGLMAAWLARRLQEPSTVVKQKTLRTLVALAKEADAPFKAAAAKDLGAGVAALAADANFASDASACLAALGLPAPASAAPAAAPAAAAAAAVDVAALTSSVQAAVMAAVDVRLDTIKQTQFELDARVENLETWLGEVEAAAGFGSPRGSPKPRPDEMAKQAMAEAKSGSERLNEIEKMLADMSASGTTTDERVEGVEAMMAELEEKVEAGAAGAVDPAVLVGEVKTSLTEHIEGIGTMMAELEEKVEAVAAAPPSGDGDSADAAALVTELKASLSERMEGTEVLLAELEEKVEASAAAAPDPAALVAEVKTSLTETIEGVEAMLVKLEEKVEAGAAASGGAEAESASASAVVEQTIQAVSDSAAAAVAELKATVEGVEAMMAELEEKVEAGAAAGSSASAESTAALETTIQELATKQAVADLEAKMQESSDNSAASLAALKEELTTHAAAVASTKDELVAQMDTDGDGTIDKSEFTVWAGEQASRVDELEKRLESALEAAKAAAVDASTGLSERVEGTEVLLAELEEKVEASAAAAPDPAALVAELKTSVTEHIEGVEAMLVELEEKVEAGAAAGASQAEGASADVAASVAELKATVEGVEAMMMDMEGKIDAAEETSAASIATLKEELTTHAAAVASTKDELVAQMDTDGDGTIDKGEFTVWAGEQASRVDELEKRLESALEAAKAAAAEASAVATIKGEKLEAWIIDLESKVEVTGDSAAMDAKFQELTESLAKLETKERVDALEAWLVEMETKAEAAPSPKPDAEAPATAAALAELEAKVAELAAVVESTNAATATKGEETEAWIIDLESKVEAFGDSAAMDAKLQELTESLAKLETKERVDALEAWLVDVDAKAEAAPSPKPDAEASQDADAAPAAAAASAELEAKVQTLSDSLAQLETKERVDSLEAWLVEVDAKTEATEAQNAEALAKAVAELTENTAASITAVRADLETKERVDGLEAWLVEIEAKIEEAGETSAASIATLKEELTTHAAAVASTKDELVAQMDTDGDGTIDKGEFTVWAGEQASRVDELEKRLESALSEAQASSDFMSEEAAAMQTKVTELSESTTAALETLETKVRVDGLEAWIVEVEAKLEEVGEKGDKGASSEETAELAQTFAAFKEATEATLASMTEELETKERVDAQEAWLVEVENKVDAGAESLAVAAEERGTTVDATIDALSGRLAAVEGATGKVTGLEGQVAEAVASGVELADKLEVVSALQEEGASSLIESVDKMGLEIEKNRLHISECAKTMGSLKTGIDGVKDRVSAHDKLDARMVRALPSCAPWCAFVRPCLTAVFAVAFVCCLQMNLKQDLEEVMDGNTKKLSDMEAELTMFTSKIERRQAEVDSMTKRIIATSGGNVEKVGLSRTASNHALGLLLRCADCVLSVCLAGADGLKPEYTR